MIRVFGLALFFSFSASAVTLKPIPNAPTARLPINMDAPNYSCAEIAQKLADYNTMARSHDQSVTSFLGQVIDRVGEWYSVLQPLENTATPIAADTFKPLQTGAEQISEITNMAFDNSERLANELDRIIVSLSLCEIK